MMSKILYLFFILTFCSCNYFGLNSDDKNTATLLTIMNKEALFPFSNSFQDHDAIYIFDPLEPIDSLVRIGSKLQFNTCKANEINYLLTEYNSSLSPGYFLNPIRNYDEIVYNDLLVPRNFFIENDMDLVKFTEFFYFDGFSSASEYLERGIFYNYHEITNDDININTYERFDFLKIENGFSEIAKIYIENLNKKLSSSFTLEQLAFNTNSGQYPADADSPSFEIANLSLNPLGFNLLRSSHFDENIISIVYYLDSYLETTSNLGYTHEQINSCSRLFFQIKVKFSKDGFIDFDSTEADLVLSDDDGFELIELITAMDSGLTRYGFFSFSGVKNTLTFIDRPAVQLKWDSVENSSEVSNFELTELVDTQKVVLEYFPNHYSLVREFVLENNRYEYAFYDENDNRITSNFVFDALQYERYSLTSNNIADIKLYFTFSVNSIQLSIYSISLEDLVLAFPREE